METIEECPDAMDNVITEQPATAVPMGPITRKHSLYIDRLPPIDNPCLCGDCMCCCLNACVICGV